MVEGTARQLSGSIPQLDGALDDSEMESDEDENPSQNNCTNQGINSRVKNKSARFFLTNARSLMQKTDAGWMLLNPSN